MRSVASVVAVISLGLLGCASDRDAIDKRFTELRDDIRRLQTSNDALAERVDSLEGKVASTPTSSSGVASGEERLERPSLKVVRVVPGLESAADPSATVSPEELPDAPGTRPVIRLRGSGREGSSARDSAVARTANEREETP